MGSQPPFTPLPLTPTPPLPSHSLAVSRPKAACWYPPRCPAHDPRPIRARTRVHLRWLGARVLQARRLRRAPESTNPRPPFARPTNRGCGCSRGRRNCGRATSVPSGLSNASACQWTFSPTPRAWLWLRGDQTKIGLREQWPILVGLKHEKSTGCHGNGRLGPVASG
jgi:hypothetical protein